MMTYSNIYALNLDLKKIIANHIPVFIANDSATLLMKVTDDGEPIDLTLAERYVVSLRRPDNIVVSGTGTFENGMLKYVLGNQEMEIEGSLSVVAQFYLNGTRVSTRPFTIKIIGDYEVDVNSSSQLPLLQQLVADGDYAKAQGNFAKTQAENLTHKGEYNSSVSYKANNVVTYGGITYMCIQDAGVGIDPLQGAYWSVVAPQARFNSQSWTATEGQTVFTLANGNYVPNSGNIEVFVGGVPQTSGIGYEETDSTTITLAEGVDASTVITARWVEGAFTISKAHNSTHYAGGQDELDATKLKNFNIELHGTTRPSSPVLAQRFYDENLSRPIWFNGTSWTDAMGNVV